MRNMPSRSPQASKKTKLNLRKIGEQIKKQRLKLGVSAIATAESAGLSRVTLHRIEKGEPSVTLGAYLSVAQALGLSMNLMEIDETLEKPVLPPKIPLSQFPQLRKLAWQIRSDKEIAPREALGLYERNWRHLDLDAMDEQEKELIDQLMLLFKRRRLLV